jgi:uncharacterized protein involved in outer membrane biogenesis
MSNENKPKKNKVVKILKWFGIILIFLLIILISVPFLFKDKIIQIVKEETNKQLNAKVNFGEFDLSIFSSLPDFRFNIKDVSVANVGEFEGDTLLSLGSLQLDLNLMSVINGEQYKIKSIILERPRVNVHVLSDGKANYDITKPSTDTSKTPSDTSKTKFKLNLNKLQISDAYINIMISKAT